MLLITGATGHTGTYLIQRLMEANCQQPIRCIVRKDSRIDHLKSSGLNIDYFTGDLGDYDFLEKAMAGVDVVIHIASIIYSGNITRAALQHQVGWVIYVHTTGRYSKYKAASQEYCAIEEAVISSGINYTILRPTMIYGSKRDRNIYKLIDYLYRHRFFPVFGRGLNLMQPIHARDLGGAIFGVLSNRAKTINQCYNVAGKYPISYRKLLTTIADNLPKQVHLIFIPYWISLGGAYLYNLFFKNPQVSVEQVRRIVEDKAFSYEAATRDFGFAPRSFAAGIGEEVREYLTEISKT